jgi:hypothetical protein
VGAPSWPGHYVVEVSAELLAFVERAFVEPALPEERETVRAEALHELSGAALTLAADGTIISSSYGVELVRAHVEPTVFAQRTFGFEKAPSLFVQLEQLDPDTLLARHPGKPDMTFRRAPA